MDQKLASASDRRMVDPHTRSYLSIHSPTITHPLFGYWIPRTRPCSHANRDWPNPWMKAYMWCMCVPVLVWVVLDSLEPIIEWGIISVVISSSHLVRARTDPCKAKTLPTCAACGMDLIPGYDMCTLCGEPVDYWVVVMFVSSKHRM